MKKKKKEKKIRQLVREVSMNQIISFKFSVRQWQSGQNSLIITVVALLVYRSECVNLLTPRSNL